MSEPLELEMVSSSAIEAQERAQIDTQIATAKRYPRDVARVKASMLALATLDDETAAGCFYTLPTRKDGEKPIQGPSVRMAEIALSSWGNLKAASRIIGDDGKSLTAQAVVIDLERNVSVSIEVRRRVTTKDGRRYSDDMVNTTANAACSIALRNATFRVVPQAIIKPVTEAAKRVALGDLKSITKTRSEIFERLKKKGIVEAQIFAAIGVSKMDEVDADKVADLIGIGNAIKEGQITLEEAFPPTQQSAVTSRFKKPEPVVAAQPTPEAPKTTPEAKASGSAGGSANDGPGQPGAGSGVASKLVIVPATDTELFDDEKLASIVSPVATFDEFRTWAKGHFDGTDTWASYSDIPSDVVDRCLAKPAAMLKGIASMKGGVK